MCLSDFFQVINPKLTHKLTNRKLILTDTIKCSRYSQSMPFTHFMKKYSLQDLMKLTFILVFLFGSISSTLSQTMVTGMVMDANGNTPLPYASVSAKGTTAGTPTNLNGEYRLPVKAGSYTLVASFMGYENLEKEVTIKEGQTLHLDFVLRAQSIMGEEVIITAMMRGQKSAISSQLNAAGIINAVAEEQIQELPDANAGDALGRLPGISLKRSGGEAQSIVLRGLNEKFSQIQLDGVIIPSTDAGSRGVDLSMFSINSLAGIEVTKALTSDMDADAIAGSVNLVTKKASAKPELRIDLGGGYNKLEKSLGQYAIGLRYNRRLFKEVLGLQMSVNAESKNRSREEYAQGWSVRPDSSYFISNLTPSFSSERRKRFGGNLLLDIDLPAGGFIRLNNFFNKTNRDLIRFQRDYPVEGSVNYNILDTEREIQSISNSLSGEHYAGRIKINWGASHALSMGKMPFSHEMLFQEGGAQGTGMANVRPEDLKGPGELLIPYAYNNFASAYLDRAYFETSVNKDRDLTANLDIERAFDFSDKINLIIKVGGKHRQKERSNDDKRFRAPYWIKQPNTKWLLDDGSIVPADYSGTSFEELILIGGSNVSLLNFLPENPARRGLFGGKYDLNPLIDPDLSREWYETHKRGIGQDGLAEYNPYQTVIKNIYSVTERISSAYGMATLNLGKMLRITGGVRIEKENNDYTAKFAPDIAGFFTFDASKVKDTTSSYSHTYVLPNIHLRFKPVSWWDLRIAATKTLARPDFLMRLPLLVVDRTASGTISRGRPDLKNTEAWNYDFISSFYHSKYGLFTIGTFYKKLDNIFYNLNGQRIFNKAMETQLNLPKGYGSYIGLVMNEPVNTEGTKLYGVEFDLQANLKFLPGFLGNFVLRGNFTMINSTTYVPRFIIEQDNSVFPPKQTPKWYETKERMEGQPGSFGNVALGYDQGGFSARLSTFFQGDYLTTVSAFSLEDRYQKSYSKWDLALKQALPKLNTEVMLNVTNLTSFKEGNFWGYRNLDNGSTNYGIQVEFGIRITL
jgi:TonB-dependent receptor